MKVITLDLETSPHIVHAWGLFNQNVGLNQIVDTTRVICFAAKWLGNRRVLFSSEFHNGREEMVRHAHSLLDECDVLVTYNGKRFDEPHLRREFVEAGLLPPSPFHHVDLYQTARGVFRFASNKLDHVAKSLGLGGKATHSGHDLWRRCMAGDEKAWAIMRRYNKRDVTLTEDAYVRLLPWIKTHPHPGLFGGAKDGCTRCGGTNLERRGFKASNALVYQQYQCKDCGAWCRSRTSVDRTETR